MSQSDRCLEGAGHLEIPDGLVMVTELDFQYGLIPKTLGNDEEKAVQGLQECCGATISLRPITWLPLRLCTAETRQQQPKSHL